jgi:hypothetical protein
MRFSKCRVYTYGDIRYPSTDTSTTTTGGGGGSGRGSGGSGSGRGSGGTGRRAGSPAVTEGIFDSQIVTIVGFQTKLEESLQSDRFLTNGLRGVPEHNSTKRGKLGAGSKCDITECADVDES